jgi:hypothetical protein
MNCAFCQKKLNREKSKFAFCGYKCKDKYYKMLNKKKGVK